MCKLNSLSETYTNEQVRFTIVNFTIVTIYYIIISYYTTIVCDVWLLLMYIPDCRTQIELMKKKFKEFIELDFICSVESSGIIQCRFFHTLFAHVKSNIAQCFFPLATQFRCIVYLTCFYYYKFFHSELL